MIYLKFLKDFLASGLRTGYNEARTKAGRPIWRPPQLSKQVMWLCTGLYNRDGEEKSQRMSRENKSFFGT